MKLSISEYLATRFHSFFSISLASVSKAEGRALSVKRHRRAASERLPAFTTSINREPNSSAAPENRSCTSLYTFRPDGTPRRNIRLFDRRFCRRFSIKLAHMFTMKGRRPFYLNQSRTDIVIKLRTYHDAIWFESISLGALFCMSR